VCFAYDRDPVFDGASFEIHKGEVVGIVGRSGAGKSTLVQLLLGLRAPQSGEILIDEHPLATLDLVSYHARIAVVPQEPRLLRGTIEDNIRFLRDGLSTEELVATSQRVGLHDE